MSVVVNEEDSGKVRREKRTIVAFGAGAGGKQVMASERSRWNSRDLCACSAYMYGNAADEKCSVDSNRAEIMQSTWELSAGRQMVGTE